MDVNIDLVFCKTGFCVLFLKIKISWMEFHILLTFHHTQTPVGGEGGPANNQTQIHVLFSCSHENTESLPRKSG